MRFVEIRHHDFDMTNTKTNNLKRATCSIELPIEKGLPTEVHVMPLGSFLGYPDGAEFHARDPQAIINRSIRKNVTKIKIDREHETTLSKSNTPVPATGWSFDYYVKEEGGDDDGIWAHVEWTPNGAYDVGQGHYGYISPEFLHDSAGNVRAITRLSVTGSPRLDVKALANQDNADFTELNFEDHTDVANDDDVDETTNTTEEKPIMNKELLEALGLDENATQEQALEAVNGLKTSIASQEETMKKMATSLKLEEGAKPEDMLALASQLVEKGDAVDPTKYVPIDDYKAVCSQLQNSQSETKKKEVSDMIDNAIASGKIAPSSKDHYMAYANQDFAGCKALLDGAPQVVKAKQETPTDTPSAAKTSLTDEEKAICSQMNLSEEEFLAVGQAS